MPLGSNVRFSARMMSSSVAVRNRNNSSSLYLPMPCSALKLPRRYFGHAAGPQHERGLSMIEVPAVGQARLDVRRRVNDAAGIKRRA